MRLYKLIDQLKIDCVKVGDIREYSGNAYKIVEIKGSGKNADIFASSRGYVRKWNIIAVSQDKLLQKEE